MKSTMKKVWMCLVVISALPGIIGFAVGRDLLNDDGSKLVGNWRGESICVGNLPACHDEQIIYRISKPPDQQGMVTITADKIVDGKPETMGILDFKYDPEKGRLTNEFTNNRYHGVWELTVTGNVMEGTLIILPEKTIVRRVKVRKEE
jgi:hypothetical protein